MDLTQILDIFRNSDIQGKGVIGRWELADLLHKFGLSFQKIGKIVDELDAKRDGQIEYESLVHWLVNDSVSATTEKAHDEQFRKSASQAGQLEEIATSLEQIASLVTHTHPVDSSCLVKHATCLRQICSVPVSKSRETEALAPREAEALAPRDVPPPSVAEQAKPEVTVASKGWRKLRTKTKMMLAFVNGRGKSKMLTEAQLGFRAQAAVILERTGSPGDSIDDLKEISIAEVKDKLAISYWRFCEGLRVYRSETVSQAIRLICSAPVPGLGDTTYLQVFDALSNSTWVNHIYPFGGLVRDILRRTVGNDIDIGFSAPAAELEKICQANGYSCELDGDYILIGDGQGDEYLEGMVISFNGIQPSWHADFSMNTLFYDFTNDIIIDKIGTAVPAVIGNRLDIPCSKDKWKNWIDINGVRVLFRYYKFLLRGYDYEAEEMAYVTEQMLDYWTRDAEHTIEVGRIALGGLVGSDDAKKIERLRQFTVLGFEKANETRKKSSKALSRCESKRLEDIDRNAGAKATFFTANSWWKKGWLILLKLSSGQ